MEIALVIGAVVIVLALIWAGTAIYGFRKVSKMQDNMSRGFARHAREFDSPEPPPRRPGRVVGRKMQ